MRQLSAKQLLVIAAFGLVDWTLCGSIVFIGRGLMPMDSTLILYAIGAR